MKKLSLFLLLLTTLIARENPFEPTEAYLEEQARMMEMEADYPSSEFQAKSKDELELEDMTPRKMPVNKPAPTAIAKTEEQLKKEAQEKAKMLAAKKAAAQKAKREKMMAEAMRKAKAQKAAAEKAKAEAMAKEAEEMAKKGPLVYVKLREDVTQPAKTMEILPFLTVEYNDNSIDLQTKYKVFKKLSLPKENKLIIDFYAEVQFFTKRHELSSDNFKKITVGNHKKEKYFRIVLLTKMAPSAYKVDVSENLVSVTLNEEMSN